MKIFIQTIVTSFLLFGCKSSFVDVRDGHKYKTVRIGKQVWLAENFSFKADSGCWAYKDSIKFSKEFGFLYNLETAQKICPKGWRLPTASDYEDLMRKVYQGKTTDMKYGGKLFYRLVVRKDDGYIFPSFLKWHKSGFSVRLAGSTSKLSDASPREFTGMRDGKGFYCFGTSNFWCLNSETFYVYSNFMGSGAMISLGTPENGYSVRYIKE